MQLTRLIQANISYCSLRSGIR